MGILQNLKRKFLVKVGEPRYMGIIRMENDIINQYQCMTSTSESPTRFEIPIEAIKLIEKGAVTSFFSYKILPVMTGSILGIIRSFRQLKNNPMKPKSIIEENKLHRLEEFAEELGIGMIGYTKLPSDLIFQEKGILYENAIILIMEMKKDKIDTAPSYESFHEVHRTYRDLGKAANKIAQYLRKLGFGAHSVHPLGGAVLTPPLAKIAGLGWHGRHGMLISPKFGPRLRITAVFTTIENLPFSEKNDHQWVEDFCTTCGVCIKKCPTSAIRDTSIEYNNGLLNHINRERCFPFFVENHGCSVCIKECQFNKIGYNTLIEKHVK
jgi:NAD-dependent dihydropyrimidine dehydrogenase PreA subunit